MSIQEQGSEIYLKHETEGEVWFPNSFLPNSAELTLHLKIEDGGNLYESVNSMNSAVYRKLF